MEQIGYLRERDGRYEFQYDPLNLTIRGHYAEWVLEAAAEVIAETEKLQSDGQIDELMTLCEFGEANEMELDSAKFDAKARFEIVPQCIVTMGTLDYKWKSRPGREAPESGSHQTIERLQDMSLTRNDTFLQNEDGVDTTGE